jgi:hypothetical protein
MIRETNETATRMTGESFHIERGDLRTEALGRRNHSKRVITFLAEADIEIDDIIRPAAAGDPLYVIDVNKKATADILTAVEAHYETERERQRRLAAEQRRDASTFTIGTIGSVQGSILGTQQNAHLAVTFDMRAIDQEIDRRGGDDADDLKTMVAEIHEMLDDRDKISRGSLVKYSELLERHSWIAGAVAQGLLGWAIGSLKL